MSPRWNLNNNTSVSGGQRQSNRPEVGAASEWEGLGRGREGSTPRLCSWARLFCGSLRPSILATPSGPAKAPPLPNPPLALTFAMSSSFPVWPRPLSLHKRRYPPSPFHHQQPGIFRDSLPPLLPPSFVLRQFFHQKKQFDSEHAWKAVSYGWSANGLKSDFLSIYATLALWVVGVVVGKEEGAPQDQ